MMGWLELTGYQCQWSLNESYSLCEMQLERFYLTTVFLYRVSKSHKGKKMNNGVEKTAR